MDIETIFEDKRPILKIFWPDESQLTVGSGGVEKIVPYQETGEYTYITWFAVYKNGAIFQRCNSNHLSAVCYE